jgi:uncharacterized protein with PQ loop repeat
MVEFLGLIGFVLLITAAIWQIVPVVKKGHNDGMEVKYLLSLELGFIFMMIYTMLTEPVLFVILDYGVSAILIGILLWYRLFRSNEKDA